MSDESKAVMHEAPRAAAAVQGANRLDYLDNLKVALTFMVVAHHAAMPYAGPLFWPYRQAAHTPWLMSFLGVNAAFFMGLFFLISGYFHPEALRRKGTRRFLLERLRRLGIPLLVFSALFVAPLMYVYHVRVRAAYPAGFGEYVVHYLFGLGPRPGDWPGPAWPDFNLLHMWFVENLLIYGVLFAVWQRFFPLKPAEPMPAESFSAAQFHRAALLYAFGLAIVTAAIELAYPQDRWIPLLGFIQMEPYHAPQYASLFAVGILAYRGNWLARIPARAGYLWLGLGGLLAVALYGNRILWSFPYILWTPYQSLLCTAMCIGVLTLFREHYAGTNPSLRWLARRAFGVYIVHYPIVIALQYAIEPAGLPPSAAFFCVSALGVAASFLAADACLRFVPGAGRVL